MVSVSVVVPCYRYGHLLRQCVDSILSQEGVQTRVLIVDDASPDDSAQVARAIAAAEPRVEVLVHERNQGHITTYNDGLLGWADGDYTVLLSADDLLVPGSLRRATAVMEDDPTVGFVYGYSQYFDGTTVPRLRTGPGRAVVWTGQRWIAHRCRSATNIISSPEVVVRTSLQRKVGGYRADLPHAGDLEMWLRLAAHMNVGIIRGADQALYRVHDASMSRTEFAAPLKDLKQRWHAFEVFFETDGQRVPGIEQHRRAAELATARRMIWRAARLQGNPDPHAVQTAAGLAEFALELCPQVLDTPEGAAYRRATRAGGGPLAALGVLPTAVTGARRRAWEWNYWRLRRSVCV